MGKEQSKKHVRPLGVAESRADLRKDRQRDRAKQVVGYICKIGGSNLVELEACALFVPRLDVRQDTRRSPRENDGPGRGRRCDRVKFLHSTLFAAAYPELRAHHACRDTPVRELAEVEALVHGHLGVGEASLQDGSHGGVQGRGPLIVGHVELPGR